MDKHELLLLSGPQTIERQVRIHYSAITQQNKTADQDFFGPTTDCRLVHLGAPISVDSRSWWLMVVLPLSYLQ